MDPRTARCEWYCYYWKNYLNLSEQRQKNIHAMTRENPPACVKIFASCL